MARTATKSVVENIDDVVTEMNENEVKTTKKSVNVEPLEDYSEIEEKIGTANDKIESLKDTITTKLTSANGTSLDATNIKSANSSIITTK